MTGKNSTMKKFNLRGAKFLIIFFCGLNAFEPLCRADSHSGIIMYSQDLAPPLEPSRDTSKKVTYVDSDTLFKILHTKSPQLVGWFCGGCSCNCGCITCADCDDGECTSITAPCSETECVNNNCSAECCPGNASCSGNSNSCGCI